MADEVNENEFSDMLEKIDKQVADALEELIGGPRTGSGPDMDRAFTAMTKFLRGMGYEGEINHPAAGQWFSAYLLNTIINISNTFDLDSAQKADLVEKIYQLFQNKNMFAITQTMVISGFALGYVQGKKEER